MSQSIKCNQGVIVVGEFDSDNEVEVSIASISESNGSFVSVYLDRRRAELLIEAIKTAHNL